VLCNNKALKTFDCHHFEEDTKFKTFSHYLQNIITVS
jgi:hypothetical protein